MINRVREEFLEEAERLRVLDIKSLQMPKVKYKQLSRDSITFIRAKTERTTRHALKPIVAMRTPKINRIIKRVAADVVIF